MVSLENGNSNFSLVDTTLRDGQQSPGVVFSMDEKIAIASKLDSIGVDELEIGIAASGAEEVASIQKIAALGLSCRLTVWCRAKKYDLEMAKKCGVNAVHISLPVSDIQIAAMGKSRRWVMKKLQSTIKIARAKFSFVSVGAQDASRAGDKFLEEFVQLACSYGADRVRLADTVGVWDPFQCYMTIMRLRSAVPGLSLGFHGHNDLSMATANAFAAIRAGAKSVDVTVNGLGERAGNTPLEEIVMACKICMNQKSSIDTSQLVDLSQMVAKASGRIIPFEKPIVGLGAFTHESGIHVRAMLKDERTYEPFNPAQVGAKRKGFVIGKSSGRASIIDALAKHGLLLSKQKASLLLEKVQKIAAAKKDGLTIDELKSLYWRHC